MCHIVRNFSHTPQNVDFLLNLTKSIRKMARAKMGFSRIGPKMSMGRVPTKIFDESEFFYRKFVKKIFRGRGPQKSTILGLFQKSILEISANWEKTSFSRPRLF